MERRQRILTYILPVIRVTVVILLLVVVVFFVINVIKNNRLSQKARNTVSHVEESSKAGDKQEDGKVVKDQKDEKSTTPRGVDYDNNGLSNPNIEIPSAGMDMSIPAFAIFFSTAAYIYTYINLKRV